MSGLVLKNVNKIYPGGQQSVKDFSLEIRDREFLILVGPAGCGKSALLRMIGGLDEISSGSLFIDGKDMTDADPKDRNIAMLFKNSVLYPGMTVEDNLSFALRMGKMAQGEIDRRIREISGYLKLSDILDKKPEELTGDIPGASGTCHDAPSGDPSSGQYHCRSGGEPPEGDEEGI